MDVSRIRVVNRLAGGVKVKVVAVTEAEFDVPRDCEVEVDSEYIKRRIEVHIKPVGD